MYIFCGELYPLLNTELPSILISPLLYHSYISFTLFTTPARDILVLSSFLTISSIKQLSSYEYLSLNFTMCLLSSSSLNLSEQTIVSTIIAREYTCIFQLQLADHSDKFLFRSSTGMYFLTLSILQIYPDRQSSGCISGSIENIYFFFPSQLTQIPILSVVVIPPGKECWHMMPIPSATSLINLSSYISPYPPFLTLIYSVKISPQYQYSTSYTITSLQ